MTAISAERRALLAKVHIAKKDLALDDATYRAVLQRLAGVTSSAAATDRDLVKVIEEFKTKGWSEQPRKGRGADDRDQGAKLRALWLSLWQLGEVEQRDDNALAAFVARHTGLQALRWNRPSDLNIAIECLKGWCKRVGYEPKPYEPADQWDVAMAGSYDVGLIEAQWRRLAAIGAFRTGNGRLDTWLYSQSWAVAAPCFLQPDQARFAVKELGQWLRRVRRNQARQAGDHGAA